MMRDAPLRLQRALAEAGVASRRKAEDLILAGRVAVNGSVVDVLGTRVDPAQDRVTVDGRPVALRPERRIFLLHKPVGRVTTREDEEGRPTVMDLVPAVPGLHPVGRLDMMTSGLLILTNDGALTHALTHPSRGVTKHYRAVVDGVPDAQTLRRLSTGILLEDGLTAPCRVALSEHAAAGATVDLWLHEGRNRQVRRMLEAVGHPVRRLARLAIGPVRLGDLGTGCWREPQAGELEWLQRCTDGSQST